MTQSNFTMKNFTLQIKRTPLDNIFKWFVISFVWKKIDQKLIYFSSNCIMFIYACSKLPSKEQTSSSSKKHAFYAPLLFHVFSVHTNLYFVVFSEMLEYFSNKTCKFPDCVASFTHQFNAQTKIDLKRRIFVCLCLCLYVM